MYAISPARFARRRLLKAAIFGAPAERPAGPESLAAGGFTSQATHTVIGYVQDVSPHVLVLGTETGEERLTLSASTAAWRGSAVAPAALRQGDRAIVRCDSSRPAVADRIWAEIGRVTGTIVERDGAARTLLVDEGTETGREILAIPPRAAERIQVRFPRLEPGHLVDVIGLRRPGFLEGLVPATSQPPYHASRPPAPPMVSEDLPGSISGTATWHEPGEEPDSMLGLSYPALDPETGCETHGRPGADAAGPPLPHASPALPHGPAVPRSGRHSRTLAGGSSGPAPYTPAAAASRCSHELWSADLYAVDPHLAGPGCVRLPYLSMGSVLQVRNDCAQRVRDLPVTGCGAASRLFCDRCVTCGTSPRGRLADLTMRAFVELGGDLERGCFNATITIGG